MVIKYDQARHPRAAKLVEQVRFREVKTKKDSTAFA
jgi:hypothetical protein